MIEIRTCWRGSPERAPLSGKSRTLRSCHRSASVRGRCPPRCYPGCPHTRRDGRSQKAPRIVGLMAVALERQRFPLKEFSPVVPEPTQMLPSRSSNTDISMSSLMLSGSSGEWRYRTALRRLRSILTRPLPGRQPQIAVGVFVDCLHPAELCGRRLAVLERIQREPPSMAIPRGQPVAGRVIDPQHARVILEQP